MKRLVLIVLLIGLRTASAQFAEVLSYQDPFFHSTDSLAARDDLDLMHQNRSLNRTDFMPRYCRFYYYWRSGHELITQPAYVGALQRDLRRLGYYCGPIDGVFSIEVSEAVARLQKNYSMQVTGTLTVSVRRALHLP